MIGVRVVFVLWFGCSRVVVLVWERGIVRVGLLVLFMFFFVCVGVVGCYRVFVRVPAVS